MCHSADDIYAVAATSGAQTGVLIIRYQYEREYGGQHPCRKAVSQARLHVVDQKNSFILFPCAIADGKVSFPLSIHTFAYLKLE